MNPQCIERKTPGAAHPGKTRLQAVLPEPPAQQSPFAAPAVAPSDAGDEPAGRLAMRSTDTLKPHPSLLKLNLRPTNERLLVLEKLGEAIYEQPLLITRENLIVDGYARWLIARRQQRATLLCIECPLTKQEALQRILQTHCRPQWLKAFSRVQLALDLEPWFREGARANQSAGGKEKASSKLTEDRRLDCRKQIATLAGVSTGNVFKVKQLLDTAIPQLIAAAQSGEVRIHNAWKLSKLNRDEQEAALASKRSKKRSQKRLRELLSKNVQSDSITTCLRELKHTLTRMQAIPRLCAIWEKIDDLLGAVDRAVLEDRRDPGE
jgi:hypothetical protein